MKEGEIAKAIHENFTSPNAYDRNGEPANVADGLDNIASAIRFMAKAILVANGLTMVDYRNNLPEKDR